MQQHRQHSFGRNANYKRKVITAISYCQTAQMIGNFELEVKKNENMINTSILLLTNYCHLHHRQKEMPCQVPHSQHKWTTATYPEHPFWTIILHKLVLFQQLHNNTLHFTIHWTMACNCLTQCSIMIAWNSSFSGFNTRGFINTKNNNKTITASTYTRTI
jgi:hypothetical protein